MYPLSALPSLEGGYTIWPRWLGSVASLWRPLPTCGEGWNWRIDAMPNVPYRSEWWRLRDCGVTVRCHRRSQTHLILLTISPAPAIISVALNNFEKREFHHKLHCRAQLGKGHETVCTELISFYFRNRCQFMLLGIYDSQISHIYSV